MQRHQFIPAVVSIKEGWPKPAPWLGCQTSEFRRQANGELNRLVRRGRCSCGRSWLLNESQFKTSANPVCEFHKSARFLIQWTGRLSTPKVRLFSNDVSDGCLFENIRDGVPYVQKHLK